MKAKSKRPHLQLQPLVDEGPLAATYPYRRLREIQTVEDCRDAVLDETRPIETEFGLAIVRPLYDLLWVLNGNVGVFTSHTFLASSPKNPPPFEWAKEYIATEHILLSRDEPEHFDFEACKHSVLQLYSILNSRSLTGDATGWFLNLRPCQVIFTPEMRFTTFETCHTEDRLGFGCSLIVGGAASNRSVAARRWSDAICFVTSALQNLQQGPKVRPAAPHRHLLP